jgi:predicted secreted protein
MAHSVYRLIVCGLAIVAGNGCRDGASPPAHGGTATSSGSSAKPTSNPGDAGVGVEAGVDAGAVIIGVQDDGKTFDVAVGSVITFALASNEGTGYVWVPTRVDPNVVAPEGARASENDSDTPGASKRDIYRFTAKAVGTASMEMSLKRPFGHAPSGRVVRVTLNVR